MQWQDDTYVRAESGLRSSFMSASVRRGFSLALQLSRERIERVGSLYSRQARNLRLQPLGASVLASVRVYPTSGFSARVSTRGMWWLILLSPSFLPFPRTRKEL